MRFQDKLNAGFDGLRCALSGLKLVFKPGLRRYVAAPILVNLVLFGVAFAVSGHYFSEFLNWLIPGWLDWLRWLLWPFFSFVFMLITLFSFSLVANLVGSLFYGRLTRKVQSEFLGNTPVLLDEPARAGMSSGLRSEVGRLLFFLSRAVPLLLLFLIPGLNLVAPFLWLGFCAWFLGMEYLAYPMEEAGVLFDEQRRILQPGRLGVTAFGGLILLGLAVPLLNIAIPPAAVIGATLYAGEKDLRRFADAAVERGE
jgi:CysZ protein